MRRTLQCEWMLVALVGSAGGTVSRDRRRLTEHRLLWLVVK